MGGVYGLGLVVLQHVGNGILGVGIPLIFCAILFNVLYELVSVGLEESNPWGDSDFYGSGSGSGSSRLTH